MYDSITKTLYVKSHERYEAVKKKTLMIGEFMGVKIDHKEESVGELSITVFTWPTGKQMKLVGPKKQINSMAENGNGHPN